ncbi:MAG: phosphopyruvate hydratase, partial [candidate division KSB1 bacterium]|nr:phosphopyruvate hydratase [candidate division KSB1 bacterium]
QLQQVYLDYFKKAKGLLSIEDPFYEKDFAGFQELKKAIGEKWIVGDDVTATSPSLIEKGATEKLINAVIIKPNQIGTVTETCQAIETARRHKIKIIVSHRSGETEDNFIIHLAKASAAEAVKIGAPVHERILKFNELIRLYE